MLENITKTIISKDGPFVRQQKIEEIERNFASKNIFILSGSPGCGKSVFAAQIVQKLYTSYVWIDLSTDDLDPVRFCHNLYVSIKKEFPKFSIPDIEKLINSDSMEAIHYETYVREILRSFRKILKKPVAIVFDRADILPTIGLACKAVRAALNHNSRYLHFIVTSRRKCGSAPAPGKNDPNVFETAPDFFTLSEDEFKAYALHMMKDTDDFSGLESIYEITGGWITAVNAAFSYYIRKGCPPSVQELAQEMNDFFRSADMQPSDKKAASTAQLLSLLDEISLNFAIRQNGSTKIANHLINMLDNNHFIFKSESTVFRLQQIYREWLRVQCFNDQPKTDIELFLHSASEYYIENNDTFKALICLLRAKTFSGIEQLIKNNAGSFILYDKPDKLAEVLQNIPGNIIKNSIWIALIYGLSTISTAPEKSGSIFSNVMKNLSEDHSGEAYLICCCGLLEHSILIVGDIKAGKRYRDEILRFLSSKDKELPPQLRLLSTISLAASEFYYSSSEEVRNYLDRTMMLSLNLKSARYRARLNHFYAEHHIMLFSFSSACSYLDQMLSAENNVQYTCLTGLYLLYAHMGFAKPVEYLSTKIRERYLRKLEAFPIQNIRMNILDADYAISAGKTASARAYTESLRKYCNVANPEYPTAMLKVASGMIDAVEFDELGAEKAEKALLIIEDSGVTDHYKSFFYLYAGAIYTLLGNFKDAEKRLFKTLSMASSASNDNVSAAAFAYLSYLYSNIGKKDLAQEYAANSMRYLRKHGTYRFTCSLPAVIDNLLQQAVKSPSTADFARQTALRHYNLAFNDNMEPIPVLCINAFGEMKIMLGEHLMSSEAFSGNFRIMIAILLSSKDYSSHQEVIQSYIWPSSDKDKARKSFDNLMSRFRKLLFDNFRGINPTDYITINNGIVRLKNTKCNANEFIELSKEAWTHYEKGEYTMSLKNVLEAKDLFTDKYFPFINDIETVDAKRQYTDRAFLDMLLLIKRLNSFVPDLITLDMYLSRWLDIYIHESDMVQLAYSYYKTKGNSLKCKAILKKFDTYLDSEGYTREEKSELLFIVKSAV